jgi:hypothetical protein
MSATPYKEIPILPTMEPPISPLWKPPAVVQEREIPAKQPCQRCRRPRVWLYRRRRRHRVHFANPVAQPLLVHHPPARLIESGHYLVGFEGQRRFVQPVPLYLRLSRRRPNPTSVTVVSCQKVSKRHDSSRLQSNFGS